MLVKVHKWHSATSKTWDTVSMPLSSISDDYLLFDSDGLRVGAGCDLSEVHAVPVPKGVEAFVAIAIVTAIVTAAFLPKPEIPQNAGQSKTSPNNQPASQSNTSRLGQGKPDIRGTVKSFPDLIQSPWYYYDGNAKQVLQKFIVGTREFGTVADIKIGETDIDNISGAKYHWQGDGTLGGDSDQLGAYHRFYPARNDAVESMKLVAIDELNAGFAYYKSNASTNQIETLARTKYGTPDGTNDFPEALEFNSVKSFFVTDDAGGVVVSEAGFFKYSSYSVVNRLVSDPGGVTDIYADVYVFEIIDRIISTTQTIYLSPTKTGDIRRGDIDANGWCEWQYIKPLPYTMLSLSWPQGIVDSSGDPASMNWEVDFKNESGTSTLVTGTKTTYDNSPVYHSIFISPTGNVERFRVRRTTTYETVKSDMIIDSCFSLGALTTLTGNGILSTTYRGGRYSSTPITGNVSIIPKPEYYTYNGSVITLVTPAGVRNSFADSVLMDLVLVYGNNLTLIKEAADIDELYDIETTLDSNERAFSYTFDDTDIDLESRIKTACNCARVIAYESNGKWRFTCDESKPVSAIFNRRNIAGNSEGDMSVSFNKPLDKNGVSVKYIDPDTFKEAYVHRSIDAASFATDEPSRPLEIDLAGCSNTTQANNRADLEVRKLVYQRRSVKEKVLSDGLEVDLGDRVQWASIYDDALMHGEIMEIIDSDAVRVSEPVTGTVYTHYTTVAGAIVGPIACTGSGFILTRTSGPSFASGFVADDDNQAGSMFIAGDTVDLDYADMTVVSISPNDDDTVDIEMTEYNELIYSED